MVNGIAPALDAEVSETLQTTESNDLATQVEAQPLEVQGQEPETAAPEPTPQELFTSARQKQTEFDQGRRNTLDLTRAEADALKRENDRLVSERDLERQIHEANEKYTTEKSATFTTAAGTLEGILSTGLRELGIEPESLTVTQVAYFRRQFGDVLDKVKADFEPAVLEPLRAVERNQAIGTMMRLGISQQEATRRANAADLSSTDPATKPSFASLAYSLGFEAGQAQGLAKDSVVKSKVDFDKAIEEAEKRGEEASKAAGRRVPPGAGSASAPPKEMTLEAIDAMPTAEWLALPKADRERLLTDAHTRARR